MLAEMTMADSESKFSTSTAYIEEVNLLVHLYTQRNHATRQFKAAHTTKQGRPKLAKAIQQVRLGCQRYPHSERARLRAEHLESIYANCDTEWSNASAELITAKAHLDQHIESHVKPSSLHLAQRILAVLPREVRDQIYTALLLTVFKNRRSNWYHSACNEFGSPELQHRDWDDDDSLPIHRLGCAPTSFRESAPYHLWDVAFLGPVVSRELVEAFYRVSRFYLVFMCSAYHAGAMNEMLSQPAWGTDVRPVDFISNVVFKLGWREHLGCARKFRKNTMFTAHLEMDRFFVYNKKDTLENSRAHMDELLALARDVRGDGYRVRIFVDGELLDLDKEVEDSTLRTWMDAYKKRTWTPWILRAAST